VAAFVVEAFTQLVAGDLPIPSLPLPVLIHVRLFFVVSLLYDFGRSGAQHRPRKRPSSRI
jgi:hypothetical protein